MLCSILSLFTTCKKANFENLTKAFLFLTPHRQKLPKNSNKVTKVKSIYFNQYGIYFGQRNNKMYQKIHYTSKI